jgi:hypothetical protein
MYGIGAMLELFDADEEEEFVEFDEFEPLLLDVSFVFVDTVEFEAGADVAFFYLSTIMDNSICDNLSNN